MKLVYAAVAATLSLALTGCVVSEQRFDQSRAILKSRPEVRVQFVSECVRGAKALSSEDRAVIAELVDLSPSNFPQAFCQRVMRSYMSGRLTYRDYRDMARGKVTPRNIRILRGRSA